ncbi:MAG: dolichol kinase [Synechococcaceae cyanobacterium]|nr:dolichol kinase [Synechococcaceae cyanobacterium]
MIPQLLGMAAVGGWLTLLAALALAVRARWPLQREWSRKLVHIGAGAVLPIAWGAGINRWVAIPSAALVTLLAVLNHRRRVLPAIEDIDRPSYGTIGYGASITLLLALGWPQQAAAVCAGVLVMAFGDGLAGLLGPLWPSPSWQVLGQRRSLLGTGVMAVASLAVLAALAVVCRSQGLAAPGAGSLVAIAAAAMLLEQVAVAGVDNVTVPLGVAALWQRLT